MFQNFKINWYFPEIFLCPVGTNRKSRSIFNTPRFRRSLCWWRSRNLSVSNCHSAFRIQFCNVFLPKSHYFCRFLLHFVAFIHRVPRSIIVARSDFSRCNLRHVRCAETSSDWARASRTHFVSSSSWESPPARDNHSIFLAIDKTRYPKNNTRKGSIDFLFPTLFFFNSGFDFWFRVQFLLGNSEKFLSFVFRIKRLLFSKILNHLIVE